MCSVHFSVSARALLLVAIVFGIHGLCAAAGSPAVIQAELGTAVGPVPVAWTYWSPRAELAHEHALVTREGGKALMLRARSFASYGHWSTRVHDIEPGTFYRFEALYQTEEMQTQTGSVFAMLSWYAGRENPRELQRDYIDRREETPQGTQASRTVMAPEGATQVRIELGLRRSDGGAVYWRNVGFQAVPPPAPRVMRVATTRIRPVSPTTTESNTGLMAEMLEQIGPQGVDFILLSENLATRGVRASIDEKAQPIPGPLTNMIADKAKKYRTHVITTLIERDGNRFHNTAVWINREGEIAGKYQKVHLTISEMENGLTPGSDYPVFDTDVGRIGIVTCWDNWFSEPMRILRLKGAEVIFLPLAGDGNPAHWEAVWPARAMDNGVFLVASSTVGSTPSRIIDPAGAVIAEANDRFAYTVADLDLNCEWRLRYLSVANGTGEARSLYLRERRPETYTPLLRDEEADTFPAASKR